MSYFVDVSGRVKGPGSVSNPVSGPYNLLRDAQEAAVAYIDRKMSEMADTRDALLEALATKRRFDIGDYVVYVGREDGNHFRGISAQVSGVLKVNGTHQYQVDFGAPGTPRIWFNENELVKAG